jgi:hypothetical protein
MRRRAVEHNHPRSCSMAIKFLRMAKSLQDRDLLIFLYLRSCRVCEKGFGQRRGRRQSDYPCFGLQGSVRASGCVGNSWVLSLLLLGSALCLYFERDETRNLLCAPRPPCARTHTHTNTHTHTLYTTTCIIHEYFPHTCKNITIHGERSSRPKTQLHILHRFNYVSLT